MTEILNKLIDTISLIANSNYYGRTIQVRKDCSLNIHPLAAGPFSYFTYKDQDMVRELDSFIAFAKNKNRFIDIGAHYGIFSLVFKKYAPTNAEALAFEPSPNAFKILDYHIKKNSFSKHIHAIQAALGDAESQITFYKGDCGHVEITGTKEAIMVQQCSLDSIRFSPDLIKIDVEGYEYEVLLGAGETIRKYHPVIFLELHNKILEKRGLLPIQVLGYLQQLDYEFYHHDGMRMPASDLLDNDVERIVVR